MKSAIVRCGAALLATAVAMYLAWENPWLGPIWLWVPRPHLDKMVGFSYYWSYFVELHIPVIRWVLTWLAVYLTVDRIVSGSRKLMDRPVTVFYALALAMASFWAVMNGGAYKLEYWMMHLPSDPLHVPLWLAMHKVLSSNWDDFIVIGLLGWVVEARIGSRGMVLAWLPIVVVYDIAQVAIGYKGYGLSGAYFPLMGAALYLSAREFIAGRRVWLLVALAVVMVEAVNAWWMAHTAWLEARYGGGNLIVLPVVFAHHIGFCFGFGVAMRFRDRLCGHPVDAHVGGGTRGGAAAVCGLKTCLRQLAGNHGVIKGQRHHL